MADNEVQRLRAQLAAAQEELRCTRRSLRRTRDENAQLADANQRLTVSFVATRATAQAHAETIDRDTDRINRLCDSVGELTWEIRTGISLATARFRRHRSEKGTKAPSIEFKRKYLLTSNGMKCHRYL
jgi:hypothetical protein